MNVEIYNEDCITGANIISDDSIDLEIFDCPFGISETDFNKHYYRNKNKTIEGYIEAPKDYADFSMKWIEQAKRILKPDGSMYIVSGYTNLHHILNAVHKHGLYLSTIISWEFQFGVFTRKKWNTSCYYILYILKDKKSKPTFNTYSRFGFSEKGERGKSLLFQDMKNVWYIQKEYKPDQMKNINKLPEGLIKKMIQYSSNEGDTVCDFFMGNFTTGFVSKKMGRKVCGFELNKNAFDHFMPLLDKAEFGCDLKNQKIVNVGTPANQGKKLTNDEIIIIQHDFQEMLKTITKRDALIELSKKYGRGRWSLERIVRRKIV